MACNGSDMNMKYFLLLAEFLEKECLNGLLSVERGGALLHLHFQDVFCLHANTILEVKKCIYAKLGWLSDSRPVSCEVYIKKLTNKDLHSFVGMVGYYMKDQGEPRHQVRMKDVSDAMLNNGLALFMLLSATGTKNRFELSSDAMLSDGLELFTLLGATDTKNQFELSSSNLLPHALQYSKYRSRHPLGTRLRSCLLSMIVSGKYAPCARWLIQPGIHESHANSLWHYYIHPRTA